MRGLASLIKAIIDIGEALGDLAAGAGDDLSIGLDVEWASTAECVGRSRRSVAKPSPPGDGDPRPDPDPDPGVLNGVMHRIGGCGHSVRWVGRGGLRGLRGRRGRPGRPL